MMSLVTTVQSARNVLFQNGMEICTAKTESTDPGPADAAFRFFPLHELTVDVKGGLLEMDRRIMFLAMQAGWNDLVVQRQNGFEDPRGAGRALQVPEIGLHGAQRDAVRGRVPPALENTSVRLSTSTTSPTRVEVPWPSTRVAVEGDKSGVFPTALDSQFLSNRVRRRDALTSAVAGPAHAAQHGENVVAIAFGVRQALQQEQRLRPHP